MRGPAHKQSWGDSSPKPHQLRALLLPSSACLASLLLCGVVFRRFMVQARFVVPPL